MAPAEGRWERFTKVQVKLLIRHADKLIYSHSQLFTNLRSSQLAASYFIKVGQILVNK